MNVVMVPDMCCLCAWYDYCPAEVKRGSGQCIEVLEHKTLRKSGTCIGCPFPEECPRSVLPGSEQCAIIKEAYIRQSGETPSDIGD